MPEAIDRRRTRCQLPQPHADVVDLARTRILQRAQPVDHEGNPPRARPIRRLGAQFGILRRAVGGTERLDQRVGIAALGPLARAFGHQIADAVIAGDAILALLAAEGLRIIGPALSVVEAQQVVNAHMQHVAHIRAQGQRTGPLAIVQAYLSGGQIIAPGMGADVIGAGGQNVVGHRLRGGHQIAHQGEDHAEGIVRSVAVVDQHLVQRAHLGADDATGAGVIGVQLAEVAGRQVAEP